MAFTDEEYSIIHTLLTKNVTDYVSERFLAVVSELTKGKGRMCVHNQFKGLEEAKKFMVDSVFLTCGQPVYEYLTKEESEIGFKDVCRHALASFQPEFEKMFDAVWSSFAEEFGASVVHCVVEDEYR